MQHLPTVTSVRKNIYSIVDQVISTGIPAKFSKNGTVLKISLEKNPNKLANLKKRDAIVGDPDELVNLKVWEWHEPNNV